MEDADHRVHLAVERPAGGCGSRWQVAWMTSMGSADVPPPPSGCAGHHVLDDDVLQISEQVPARMLRCLGGMKAPDSEHHGAQLFRWTGSVGVARCRSEWCSRPSSPTTNRNHEPHGRAPLQQPGERAVDKTGEPVGVGGADLLG